ncbi:MULTISPECIES: PP2C family protein-serine/threonine phosphatase [Streptomyces]|uniref:PP2C family protein-serine/threonine phosphatase n=1 Tax=Streptomyces TaxID=1883 RepID=UPI0022491BFF|nr:SpoIIE family protein phosphatase [Streptomyces sp. JHD 1]MCX2968506.1 SpoIIE family protein phosphatase [Streptomyces sp. JHD 1]
MSSYSSADSSAAPRNGALDVLISQARRLRGSVAAVRQEAQDTDRGEEDARQRWQRALCDLAVLHLDDLGHRLDELRDGPPPQAPHPPAEPAAEEETAGRVGSAEWSFLTDEVEWSPELYAIFDRSPEAGPLSLDELPTWLLPDDQAWMMRAVTDCLVDGRPVDGEFNIVRDDGTVRTVHMRGEPVLERDGTTAALWAVVRDVSSERRGERVARKSRDIVRQQRHRAHTERRLAAELQEAVLPPWRGTRRFSRPDGGRGGGGLEIAGHYLPATVGTLAGGSWYDALGLPDGATLLTVGDLTGHGVEATSGMAMLLGAVRGLALAGTGPGALMSHLNHLLDTAEQPALGSALCCRYDPGTARLTWARAGHPTPVRYRAGRAERFGGADGVLLGATTGAEYAEGVAELRPGDTLLLHTEGLAGRAPVPWDAAAPDPLPGLAPRITTARSAQECVRTLVEEYAGGPREDDACFLVARVPDARAPAARVAPAREPGEG